jgi:NAD+-dependent protein deacetylase sirtuin 4
VKLCQGAVDNCDGLLVVGSSLAVHSAFRHVKTAHKQGIPIAILNVGETRAEIEQLNVLKLEAPAGPTLDGLVSLF